MLIKKKSTVDRLVTSERDGIKLQKERGAEPYAWNGVNLKGFEEMEKTFLEREEANRCGVCNEHKGEWGHKYVGCGFCQRKADLLRRASEDKNNREILDYDDYLPDEPEKFGVCEKTFEVVKPINFEKTKKDHA